MPFLDPSESGCRTVVGRRALERVPGHRRLLLAGERGGLSELLTPPEEAGILLGITRQAVLEAAGGCLTRPDGSAFLYGKTAEGYRNGPFIAWGRGPS